MTKAFYNILILLVVIEAGVILYFTKGNYLLNLVPISQPNWQNTIPQKSMMPESRPKPGVLAEKDEIKSNNSAKLEEGIKEALEGTTGTYAIVVKNLKTGESYSQNEDVEFEPGSLYKLWVMASVFKQIDAGALSEDDVLSQNIATLNRKFSIDPENAELTSGGITLSVKNALNQMITISHNYAALLLVEKIKLSTVATFLEEYNFSKSKVGTAGGTPITTASDIAKYMEDLYNGKLGTTEHTTEMIELLKKQRLNNKLPSKLPANTIMAHKTGEIGMFTHDAGIVYTPKGDYIIVVLSKSAIPKAAEDRIGNISKSVFNYFSAN